VILPLFLLAATYRLGVVAEKLGQRYGEAVKLNPRSQPAVEALKRVQ
jgi:hypothetical protein